MNKVDQGKKPTRQEALNTVSETNQRLIGLTNAMGQLAQGHMELDKGLQGLSTHLSLLIHILMDKGIMTKETFEEAYQKYIVQPQEEGLSKHIELLKQQSAEDAYFAVVLEKVRAFKFDDKEINGEQVSGTAIRNFYIQALVNPETRWQVLPEVSAVVPDLPTFTPVSEESAEEEVNLHPDCHYCGKPECTFCNPITVDEPAHTCCDCGGSCQVDTPTVE